MEQCAGQGQMQRVPGDQAGQGAAGCPRGGRVVAAWWPMEGGLFLGFHFLRETKQEGREREDEKKRRRFQVYHHKLGLGERAWGPRRGARAARAWLSAITFSVIDRK